MGIPLAVFYFIYLALTAIFLLISLLAIYELLRYGKADLITIVVILFYLAIAVVILYISWGYTSQINWNETIPILSGFETKSPNLGL